MMSGLSTLGQSSATLNSSAGLFTPSVTNLNTTSTTSTVTATSISSAGPSTVGTDKPPTKKSKKAKESKDHNNNSSRHNSTTTINSTVTTDSAISKNSVLTAALTSGLSSSGAFSGLTPEHFGLLGADQAIGSSSDTSKNSGLSSQLLNYLPPSLAALSHPKPIFVLDVTQHSG